VFFSALYGHEYLTQFNESQMEELKRRATQQQQFSQETVSSSPQSSGSQIKLRNEVSILNVFSRAYQEILWQTRQLL
jgi:hypothetical protein